MYPSANASTLSCGSRTSGVRSIAHVSALALSVACEVKKVALARRRPAMARDF